MHNYLKAIFNWAKILRQKIKGTNTSGTLCEEFQLPDDFVFCHKETVHIFVRGMADGKMHSAKNRNYSDVRFYKKDGLKVFCTVCRKRLI